MRTVGTHVVRGVGVIVVKIIDEDYVHMVDRTNLPLCWYCGRWPHERPSWWHAPFLLERAHIVNKPRAEDRRAVILLCSLCHKGCVHGERYTHVELPRLSMAGMLWLKRACDGDRYDRFWLQLHTVGKLPRAMNPYRGIEMPEPWASQKFLHFSGLVDERSDAD